MKQLKESGTSDDNFFTLSSPPSSSRVQLMINSKYIILVSPSACAHGSTEFTAKKRLILLTNNEIKSDSHIMT